MRLHEITYSKPRENIPFSPELINTVRRDCSDIIKIYRSFLPSEKYLFRGIRFDGALSIKPSTTAATIFKSHSLPTRKPKDVDPRIHAIIVKKMTQLGYKAHRGNSIFASSDMQDAQVYGIAYMILPINGFSYTWSLNFGDLFYGLDYDDLDKYLKKFNIKIKSSNDEYDYNKLIPKFTKLLQNTELFKKFFEFRTSNIKLAMEKRHEVMINGGYYAFKYGDFEPLIRKIVRDF